MHMLYVIERMLRIKLADGQRFTGIVEYGKKVFLCS